MSMIDEVGLRQAMERTKRYTDNEVADLKAYIGYTDSDIYGLEADFENNKFTRLAGAVGKNPGADFDSIRAFGGRRRCAVADDGAVAAYYGEAGYEEDGSMTIDSAYVLCQCMVEQPKFYYKVVPLKTEKIDGADGYHLRKARYYISDTPKPGFKVHPAFVRNGVEMDKIYLSAYEGCIYHIDNNAYDREDAQRANFDTDRLSGIVDALPASGTTQELTRANAQKLARNRGEGWSITTIQSVSATQLLFVIEYASFNSQTAIGNGVVANNAVTIKTGSTSSLGNASGSVESGGVSYRGEENLWGNKTNIIDNVDFNKIQDTQFSYMSVDGQRTGHRIQHRQSYISSFGYVENFDWLFVPCMLWGTSALPVGDFVWNVEAGTMDTICFYGGGINTEAGGGLFTWNCNQPNTWKSAGVGARLVYFPTSTTTTPASEEVT